MQRDWSQIRPNTLLGKVLRLPLRAIPRRAVLTTRSGLNKGLKWVAGSSVHGCWLGTYEPEKQAALRRLAKPGMKAFDIGANAGFYTLALSRLVGPAGHIWAFEPFAENAASILRHLTLNRVSNVTVLQSAVADRAGMVGFKIGDSNATGAIESTGGRYRVPVVTLDALVADGTLPLPDLIKIDVEGAESMVLAGAAGIMERGKPVLLVALHSEREQRECYRLLGGFGYTIHLLNGQKSPDPLSTSEVYATPSL